MKLAILTAASCRRYIRKGYNFPDPPSHVPPSCLEEVESSNPDSQLVLPSRLRLLILTAVRYSHLVRKRLRLVILTAARYSHVVRKKLKLVILTAACCRLFTRKGYNFPDPPSHVPPSCQEEVEASNPDSRTIQPSCQEEVEASNPENRTVQPSCQEEVKASDPDSCVLSPFYKEGL